MTEINTHAYLALTESQSFENGYSMFSIHDGQWTTTYTDPCLIQNQNGILSMSSLCKVAKEIRDVAKRYGCEDPSKNGRMITPNPNGLCMSRTFSIIDTVTIFFQGIFITPDSDNILLFYLI